MARHRSSAAILLIVLLLAASATLCGQGEALPATPEAAAEPPGPGCDPGFLAGAEYLEGACSVVVTLCPPGSLNQDNAVL